MDPSLDASGLDDFTSFEGLDFAEGSEGIDFTGGIDGGIGGMIPGKGRPEGKKLRGEMTLEEKKTDNAERRARKANKMASQGILEDDMFAGAGKGKGKGKGGKKGGKGFGGGNPMELMFQEMCNMFAQTMGQVPGGSGGGNMGNMGGSSSSHSWGGDGQDDMGMSQLQAWQAKGLGKGEDGKGERKRSRAEMTLEEKKADNRARKVRAVKTKIKRGEMGELEGMQALQGLKGFEGTPGTAGATGMGDNMEDLLAQMQSFMGEMTGNSG